jgi:S-adenosylmethionine decarboxylase
VKGCKLANLLCWEEEDAMEEKDGVLAE